MAANRWRRTRNFLPSAKDNSASPAAGLQKSTSPVSGITRVWGRGFGGSLTPAYTEDFEDARGRKSDIQQAAIKLLTRNIAVHAYLGDIVEKLRNFVSEYKPEKLEETMCNGFLQDKLQITLRTDREAILRLMFNQYAYSFVSVAAVHEFSRDFFTWDTLTTSWTLTPGCSLGYILLEAAITPRIALIDEDSRLSPANHWTNLPAVRDMLEQGFNAAFDRIAAYFQPGRYTLTSSSPEVLAYFDTLERHIRKGAALNKALGADIMQRLNGLADMVAKVASEHCMTDGLFIPYYCRHFVDAVGVIVGHLHYGSRLVCPQTST